MDRWIVIAALTLAFAPTAVAAQPRAILRREPPEISLGVEHFNGTYGELSAAGMNERQWNLTGTIPVDDRFAVEAVVSRGQRPYGSAERTEGLFGVQIQQRFRRAAPSPVQPFLTYGILAYR